jgi:hypothetical protein
MHPDPPSVVKWSLRHRDDLVPTRGSGHLHWTISAFMEMDKEGTMHDSCTVSVEADNEVQAICRAQEIIQRSYYRVSAVNESCSLDEALKNEVP